MGSEGSDLDTEGIGLSTETGIVVLELPEIGVRVYMGRRHGGRESIRIEAGGIDDGLEALDGFLEGLDVLFAFGTVARLGPCIART